MSCSPDNWVIEGKEPKFGFWDLGAAQIEEMNLGFELSK